MSRTQPSEPLAALFRRHGVTPVQGRLKMRLLARVRKPLRLGLWFSSWCSAGRGSFAGLSWRQIFDSLRWGFFPRSYTLYELHRNDASEYFSDRAFTLHSEDWNGSHNHCINSKHAFAHTLQALGLRTPEIYGVLHGGRMQPEHAGAAVVPAEIGISSVLAENQRAVLKPIRSWGGRGIAFLELRDGALLLNDTPISAEDLAAIARRLESYLLTEFAEQHAYAAEIFPGTANTVRLLTLWDSTAGAPYVAAAAHRFGTKRTGRLDNFHGGLGGVSAVIDRRTGVLGEGATLGKSGIERLQRHPDTGAPIAGVAIPGWHELTQQVLVAAARLPYAPYIGWDLVVTEQGVSCLEGNAPAGTFVWQVHEPLLLDPRNRRFFAEHGALRQRR